MQQMQIQGTEIQIKEYQGKRVVTLKDVDAVHQRKPGTASRNFNQNRNRFIEDIDFFRINVTDNEIRSQFGISPNAGGTVILITETGYLMLVKSFTDDLAWKVQRELVDSYFRARVKSLSEDIGWVDFSTTYNGITITKRFNIAKQYAGGNGTNGKDATVYYLECETTTIKRCSNSSGGYDYSPSPLVFHLYSQTGAEERKQNISGRWTFEYTEDGSTWNAISGTGVGIDMKFSAWDRITDRTTAIRCTVGNSSGVILGMLSVSVLADAEVTREAVFNALTDNGDRQLIAYGSDGKLYINGEYIKSKTITADLIDVNTLDAIVAKIGGFVVGSSSIHTSGRNSMTSTTQGVYIGINGFSVYKDTSNYFNMNTSVGLQIKGGTIKLGNVTLAEASDKKSLSVKYGMQVHTQRSSGQFTDGSGEFKLINLTTVSSGYQTLCIASNIVYKLSSSSKRYKNHVRDMDSSEADKLLKVPVVWFQYKKGYLKEGDSFEDKPVPGFYAEDVYKQYPEGVIFNEDGQIEDWNYRTMIPAMMKVIQNQNERINTLEDTVNTLNERLNKLEEMLKGVVK